jgi:hypothetical protein
MGNEIPSHIGKTKVRVSQLPPVVESANPGTWNVPTPFIALLSNPHRLIGLSLTIRIANIASVR